MSKQHRPENPDEEAYYPMYCDYSCPYAGFADPSSTGACRRDIGVWCAKLFRYHSKHAKCLMRTAPQKTGNPRRNNR